MIIQKQIIIGILILLCSIKFAFTNNKKNQGDTKIIPTFTEWENPQIFQINREISHAHFIPFESKKLAKKGDPEDSKYYQSLNGTWKFNYSNLAMLTVMLIFRIS